MNHRLLSAVFISSVLPFVLCHPAEAAAGSEIKGAAILDHPCGKVSIKQMGLVHAGKMDDANQLATKETQEQWEAMPAKDRRDYPAAIRSGTPRGVRSSPNGAGMAIPNPCA